jgi:ferredoxin--NADP+ reductase
VPFDDHRGVIPNDGGRVLTEPAGAPVAGLYCVGWIKRGPTGVIGTNKKDAHETVDVLLEDLAAGRLPQPADPDPAGVAALVAERKADHVTYTGWEAIDAVEKSLGEPQGRPRVKLCSRDELLKAADQDPKAAQPA